MRIIGRALNRLSKVPVLLLYGGEAVSRPVSPFVLSEGVANALLKQLGPPLVVATFDGSRKYDAELGGRFPEGAVTCKEAAVTRLLAAPSYCQRVRFSLSAGGDHAEVFVKVPDHVSNWRFFQVFNLWYRAGSAAARLFVTFTDARGQRWRWMNDGVLKGQEWCLLRGPFTEFDCSPESRKDGVQHRERVSQVTFQVICREGAERCKGYVDLYQAFLSH